MSKNIVLDVENVSKQYRLGEVGTGTLQHDIKRWWANIRGKEDPYLKIGETNDRTQKGDSDYVWALKDINFQVEQGQAVGIIGRNGAGKSTLLKLLSRVTKPTTGSIKYKGRIASLLEVGTGFHPEMTGRENIYLNGAILGMTRKEITRKFDEIVDFAGVERYIDTPVKRYSSGMYVRLAFAVAAHLESEILIVDEVLAVGDAEFQKKCLGKMGDVTKGEGRTVLFVSHNISSVKQLCNYGIYMKNGLISQTGEIEEIINIYLSDFNNKNSVFKTKVQRNELIYFKEVKILNELNIPTAIFDYDDKIIIEVNIENLSIITDSKLFITVNDLFENRIFSSETNIIKDKDRYVLEIESKFLAVGNYNLTLFIHIPKLKRYDEINNVCHFEVIDTKSPFLIHGSYNHGIVYNKSNWK
ncbi:ABC transporter ATP-binding protein [Empedobacter sp. GD03739]|uniref:ABC transporter ATP-binding protein n=1 Tax=Empedobacter sp. GD03739 TaxID=2975376 RepID=UPI00244970EA|nr:ABC transporter ATP-binding protein [Empedobacter sp. GD03739]MDH1601294.1 ABC transporter ATP-binding protein [Empedobacter sp. GD03739]